MSRKRKGGRRDPVAKQRRKGLRKADSLFCMLKKKILIDMEYFQREQGVLHFKVDIKKG